MGRLAMKLLPLQAHLQQPLLFKRRIVVEVWRGLIMQDRKLITMAHRSLTATLPHPQPQARPVKVPDQAPGLMNTRTHFKALGHPQQPEKYLVRSLEI